ncbi:MAG: hypothetical protein ACKO6N_12720 [Myxococcota bacterium]
MQLNIDMAASQAEVEFTTKFNSLDGKTPGGPIRGLLRVVQSGSGPRFVVKLADDTDAAVTAVSLEVVAPPESGWPQKSALALEHSGSTLRFFEGDLGRFDHRLPGRVGLASPLKEVG